MATIKKRGEVYYVIYRAHGKQVWERVGSTFEAARSRKNEIERQELAGEPQPIKRITFNELVEKWKPVHETKVKAKTMKGYETHLKLLQKHFGRYKVKSITAEMIENFIASLLLDEVDKDGNLIRKAFEAQTVTHYLRTLKLILKQGVKWKYLSSNPGEHVKPPRIPQKEMLFLNHSEMVALMSKTLPEHKALISVACLAGLRRGEIQALSWSDINFFNSTIRVSHALSNGKIAEPKSKASRRLIPVPPSLMEILKAHQLRQTVELESNPHDLVFPSPNGNILDHGSIYRYILWPSLKRANLPKIRLHDLRHSYCAELISLGEHPRVIQTLMGHSSMQTTMKIYAHVTAEGTQKAANKLEEAFFPKNVVANSLLTSCR